MNRRGLSRRPVLLGMAATGALTALGGLSGGAAAEVFPPTDGEMSDFILLKERAMAPDLPFQRADGSEVTMADYKGQVLIVNFWATWCAPCIHELPSLDRLQAAIPDDDFTVLAISQDRGGVAKAEPFLREELGLSRVALGLDPKMALGRAFKNRGIPVTYAIDREGRIVGHLTGIAEWDSPEAQAIVRHLLDEGSGTQS